MTEPYVGEIRVYTFAYAPQNWAQCDGQILPVQQNNALYSLLGTTFGGDGIKTFGLPDLRGRVALDPDYNTYKWGRSGGAETVVVAAVQLPAHTHALHAVSTPAADKAAPPGRFYGAVGTGTAIYAAPGTTAVVALAANAVGNAGANAPHNNMQPFLALNFCIAISGLYPSRN